MLKKVILFICAAAIIVSAAPVFAASKFHIGVVTGTVSQGEDVIRGAEKLVEMYGDVSKGGMIKHITYPDNFMQEMETTNRLRIAMKPKLLPRSC